MSNPTDMIAAFKDHPLYPAAVRRITRVQGNQGDDAAIRAASELAVLFEEAVLRDAVKRYESSMTETPGLP